MVRPNGSEPEPGFDLNLPEGFGDALRDELAKIHADPDVHTEAAYREVLENLLGAALQALEIAQRGSDCIRMYRQFRDCQERAAYMPDRIPAIGMLLYTSFRSALAETAALFTDYGDSDARMSAGEVLCEGEALSGVLSVVSRVRDDVPMDAKAIRSELAGHIACVNEAVSKYNSDVDRESMLEPGKYAETCSVMDGMFTATAKGMSCLVRMLSGQDTPDAGGYDMVMKPGIDAVVYGLESTGLDR